MDLLWVPLGQTVVKELCELFRVGGVGERITDRTPAPYVIPAKASE